MDTHKEKLLNEKKLLEDELQTIGEIDEKGNWESVPNNETINQEVQDEADMAERSEDYEERSSKLNLLSKRLNDVNHALSKIGTKDFGICEVCGNKIEEDRMEVNTSARTCKGCMDKIL